MPLLGPIGGGLGGGAPPSATGAGAGGGGGGGGGGPPSEALTTSLEFLWFLGEKMTMDGVEVGLVVELGVGVRTNPEAADAMLQLAITLSASNTSLLLLSAWWVVLSLYEQ